MTTDVLSIGIKFENFMQAGCRDLGSHHGRTVYCRKPIILPKQVLFFGTFLELPVLPSIICGEKLKLLVILKELLILYALCTKRVYSILSSRGVLGIRSG